MHKKEIKKNCLTCGKEFFIRKYIQKRSKGNYCCHKCAYIGVRKRVKVKCASCGKLHEKRPSQLKNSKSGFYFCSRDCKDKAQRIGGIKEIQPPHYKDGKYVYRKNALAFYINKCACCDYDECVDILEVHHIDGNRKNNNLDNLIILCPNCHRKITKDLFVLEILGNGTARRGHLICNQNSR